MQRYVSGAQSPSEAVEAAEAALHAVRAAGDGTGAVAALRAAATALWGAAQAVEEAQWLAEARHRPAMPDPVPGQSAGDRIRALRAAMALTVEDVRDVTLSSMTTLRGVEEGKLATRERQLIVIAAALAALGDIDGGALRDELVAAARAAGLVLPAGEHDAEWVDRRLRDLQVRAANKEREVVRRRLVARVLAGQTADNPRVSEPSRADD
jgi:hypothetical protein